MSHVPVSKLPVACGILRQAVTREGPRWELDEVYSDITDVGDILSSLSALVRQLRGGLAGLPGIVEGLRVDPSFESDASPELVRDRAATRLADVADALESLAAQVGRAHQDVAALFIDDYQH